MRAAALRYRVMAYITGILIILVCFVGIPLQVAVHNTFIVNDIVFACETGFPVERMNNFGSSLVFGHPQGPTGTRRIIELIEELIVRGGRFWIVSRLRRGRAAHCFGHPQVADAIGNGWTTDFGQIEKLKPLAVDPAFRNAFRRAKRDAKSQFANWLRSASGQTADPDSIFDCQIKRIHEYKRQLLNALRIIVLYNRLRANPGLEMAPRTFFFAGKAAPAYQFAKLVIKFLNNLAGTIDGDPVTRGRLRVVFLPDYCVSLAERLIPAADVSNQISTAGYEASGTSNMKFMMNGALTVGTRDGATIEMAQEAGEENFFLFGLSAQQVADSRGWYNPYWHYEHESETRAALDLIAGDYFSRYEPGIFAPLRDALLAHGDHYMHLADLKSYLEADQRLGELYADGDGWARKAILNIAGSGKFSSDRTIAQYAAEIWNVKPCPVP